MLGHALVAPTSGLAAGGDFQSVETHGQKPPGADVLNRYVGGCAARPTPMDGSPARSPRSPPCNGHRPPCSASRRLADPAAR